MSFWNSIYVRWFLAKSFYKNVQNNWKSSNLWANFSTQLFRCPSHQTMLKYVTEPLLVEVDRIFHLACPASPIFYKYNPVKTIKTNVIGTLNMLGLAKQVEARILVTSTSEVYGDLLVHPQDESYWGNVNPIGVRSCYDEGKGVAGTLMFNYHSQLGIEIRIARIFNSYGPRMNIDDGRVVSNFIASNTVTSHAISPLDPYRHPIPLMEEDFCQGLGFRGRTECLKPLFLNNSRPPFDGGSI